MRACSVCHAVKAESQFYVNVGSTCIECHRARSREWKRRNPERTKELARASYERSRDALLLKKYGIGVDKVRQIVADQGGTCANPRCDRPVTDRSHIDHDHVMDVVRGVMCQGCNQSLGLCKEELDRIVGLAEYLLRYVLGQDIVRPATTSKLQRAAEMTAPALAGE